MYLPAEEDALFSIQAYALMALAQILSTHEAPTVSCSQLPTAFLDLLELLTEAHFKEEST